MKKRIVWLIAVVLAPVMVAHASPSHAGAGVSIRLPGFGLHVGSGGVGLNVGLPWVVAPAPVPPPVYAYPVNAYESAVLEDAPEFVQPPELGFYVAVGVPYDLFFYNNSYWINRGNVWYNSAYYNGPWSQIYYTDIPYAFNRFPFERIRHYRDSYYGRYQRSGAWQGYTHFRPERRNDYRGRPGSNRQNYARPQNQSRINSFRTNSRPSITNRQGRGSGYTANSLINRKPNYRDTRTYTRSSNRPAQIRSSRFVPGSVNRAVNTRPETTGQSYGKGYANTRQYTVNQGSERNRFSHNRNSRDNSGNRWLDERR